MDKPQERVSATHRSITEPGLAALLVACFVALALVSIFNKPTVSYDPSFGFLIWHSMAQGAAFNNLRMASPANLAIDHDSFWAPHSPGQYLVPGLISKAAGLSLGTSIKFVTLVGTALGIAGYYLLYVRIFRFSRTVALLACIVILFRRETLYGFITYSGGPVLMFAAIPFFLMGAWACLRKRGLYLTLLIPIFLVAAFLKLSFILIAASLVLASVLSRFIEERPVEWHSVIWRSVNDGVVFLVFYWFVYILHTSKGWTAAQPGLGRSLAAIGFFGAYSLGAIASAMMSWFWSLASMGCPLHFVDANSFHTVPIRWVAMLVLAAAASAALLWAVISGNMRRSQRSGQEYAAILVGLTAVHLVALTSLFLGGALIGEDRHFWPVSAVLLPGVISTAMTARPVVWRAILVVVAGWQAIYGISAAGVGEWRAHEGARSSSLQISFPTVPQRVVDTLERLDSHLSGRNVFFFADPALALCIRHNAVLVPTNLNSAFSVGYSGTQNVDHLFVVLHNDLVWEKKISAIESSFKGAQDWEILSMGAYDVLCAGCGPAGLGSLSSEPVPARP